MDLSLNRLKAEFEDVGERVEDDLSAAHASLVRDVHDGSYEFAVAVYGRGGVEDAPVVIERLSPASGILDEEALEAGALISPSQIAALFPDEIRRLLSSRGLKIVWNPDWPSQAWIDPLRPTDEKTLRPEDR